MEDKLFVTVVGMRDFFAAQALCGMMVKDSAYDNPEKAATWAYDFADEMLKVRKTPDTKGINAT